MKFLARQPILNRERELFAYELLFRSGIQNSCDALDLGAGFRFDVRYFLPDRSAEMTAGTACSSTAREISCCGTIFRCSRADLVVVELLETIEPDEEVIDACQRLKQAGYMLALDDFVDSPDWAPLVALADFIKVDFRLTTRWNSARSLRGMRGKEIRMLAEKVETPEEFAAAMEMGYSLFQGYFFCRPEMMQHRAIPSFKLAYLELLAGGHRSRIRHEGTGLEN